MSAKIAAVFFVRLPNLCAAYIPVSHAATAVQSSTKAAYIRHNVEAYLRHGEWRDRDNRSDHHRHVTALLSSFT